MQEIDASSPQPHSLRGSVGQQELLLYHLLLIERVLVPVGLLSLIAIVDGAGRSATVALALIGWTGVTSWLMWKALDLLKRRPQLLVVDQAVAVAAWLLIGRWRGDFYLTLAEPIIAAAIFFRTSLAVAFAAVDTVLAVVALRLLHLPDGRGTKVDQTAQEWVGPPTLFIGAAVVLSYIRHLLGRLDEFGKRIDRQEEARANAERRAAQREGRRELLNQAHDDLLTLFPAFRMRLNLAADAVAPGSSLASELEAASQIAGQANERLQLLLLEFKPPPQEDAAADGEDEPEELAAELAPERRRLYDVAVKARLVLALSIGAFMYDEYRFPRFATILALWIVLVAWVTVTTVFSKSLYAVVRREPRWLIIEQALGVFLMLSGTNIAGNIFWTPAASGVVFAAIVAGWRLTLAFGVTAVLAATASVAIARVLGWQNVPSGPGIVAGTIGYAGIAAPAIYVSLLFGRLDQLGSRFRAETLKLREALWRDSAATERARVADLVAASLGETLPAINERLANARHDASKALPDDEDLETAASFLRKIDLEVARLGTFLQGDFEAGAPPTTVREVVEAACRRLVRLGAEPPVVGPFLRDALLPQVQAGVLERLVGESLINAWKHGAPPIEVTATVVDGSMVLTIVDHGAGFDVLNPRRGLGLQRLDDDAMALGGTLTVTSSPEGTSVRFLGQVEHHA